MSRDRANAQRIARDLIAEIASEWKTAESSRCVQRSTYYLFEFVIETARYTRFVRGPLEPLSPSADSTLLFNPFAEATEIVLVCIEKLQGLTTMEPEMKEFIIRRDGKARIRQMITLAPSIFKDALWQTRIIAEAVTGLELMETFGRPDIARGMVNETLGAIQERLKKHIGKVSPKRNPKINRSTINKAIQTYFPKFKETKELPSQNQFAKTIGVTAKAWRTFLKNHHLEKHEITIKEWYEFMLAKTGTNEDGDSPLGD